MDIINLDEQEKESEREEKFKFDKLDKLSVCLLIIATIQGIYYYIMNNLFYIFLFLAAGAMIFILILKFHQFKKER